MGCYRQRAVLADDLRFSHRTGQKSTLLADGTIHHSPGQQSWQYPIFERLRHDRVAQLRFAYRERGIHYLADTLWLQAFLAFCEKVLDKPAQNRTILGGIVRRQVKLPGLFENRRLY